MCKVVFFFMCFDQILFAVIHCLVAVLNSGKELLGSVIRFPPRMFCQCVFHSVFVSRGIGFVF